jgi:hypothetical protein
MKKRMGLAFGCALAASVWSGAALAQEEPPLPPPAGAAGGDDAGGVSPVRLGALIGYGLGEGDLNLYQLGIGFRGGYKFDFGLYVGGTFVWHTGESKETDLGGSKVKSSLGIYYYGVELGYGIAAGPVEIMPFLGLGGAAFHAEVCVDSVCGAGDSESKTYLSPGAQLLYPLGGFFLGADARYVMVNDLDDANSVAFYATLGGHF